MKDPLATTTKSLVDRLAREPVMFFGAVGLSIHAWFRDLVQTAGKPDNAKEAALAGILLWLTRTFSTSKRTSEENVEVAKWVGAAEQAPTPPTAPADFPGLPWPESPDWPPYS